MEIIRGYPVPALGPTIGVDLGIKEMAVTSDGRRFANPKALLAERTFKCESCGLVIDRDSNAALNLAALIP